MKTLLSPAELAEQLGVPRSTVYLWNSHRTGPAYIRAGRHVRYRQADIDDWLAGNTIDPKADAR